MIRGTLTVITAMEEFHPVHFVGHYFPPQGYMWSRGEIEKASSNVQAREHVARSSVENVEVLSGKKKNSIGQKRSRISTVHES